MFERGLFLFANELLRVEYLASSRQSLDVRFYPPARGWRNMVGNLVELAWLKKSLSITGCMLLAMTCVEHRGVGSHRIREFNAKLIQQDSAHPSKWDSGRRFAGSAFALCRSACVCYALLASLLSCLRELIFGCWGFDYDFANYIYIYI